MFNFSYICSIFLTKVIKQEKKKQPEARERDWLLVVSSHTHGAKGKSYWPTPGGVGGRGGGGSDGDGVANCAMCRKVMLSHSAAHTVT